MVEIKTKIYMYGQTQRHPAEEIEKELLAVAKKYKYIVKLEVYLADPEET